MSDRNTTNTDTPSPANASSPADRCTEAGIPLNITRAVGPRRIHSIPERSGRLPRKSGSGLYNKIRSTWNAHRVGPEPISYPQHPTGKAHRRSIGEELAASMQQHETHPTCPTNTMTKRPTVDQRPTVGLPLRLLQENHLFHIGEAPGGQSVEVHTAGDLRCVKLRRI